MTDENKDRLSVHEIGGRLHAIEEVRDASGKLITNIASPLRVELKREDIARFIAGALMLRTAIAFTQEVWTLGKVLP